MEHTIELGVMATSKAQANVQIAELQTFLRERAGDVSVSRLKDDASSQDMGTILVATFAAPAIVELAKGIADWMGKRNVKVTIGADGTSLEGPPAHVEKMLREVLYKQGLPRS